MTDVNRGSLELPSLIALAAEAAGARISVAIPAIVKSYDPETRTCVAQPVTRHPIETLDGDVTHEEWAPIPNVPVVFPGAASLTIYFALAAGDVVELVFQDFSIAQWRGTGKVSDAGDLHAHSPSYPVAIPFYRPNGKGGTDASDESIGKPGGLRLHFKDGTIEAGAGSDFVAMAAKVDARISAIETYLTALTLPVSGATAGPPAVPYTPGAPTASTNLKAE